MKDLNGQQNTIKTDFQISPSKKDFLKECYTKTDKQLYITKLQMNKHSYTLNQNIQDI